MNIQEGLIFTNEKCVGCNKCISVCSCVGATIATTSTDAGNVIRVDRDKCIACGACFKACDHNAREYMDDTALFLNDLKAGQDISILVAPSFAANYPEECDQILGKLKTLGVKNILSVAYGANITTWAYLNYIKENGFVGGISQPCPATVEYIEKYIPELIPKLMPIQSPMMCMAIYARKELGIKGRLAFLGPCIAKKKEITSKRGAGIVSYNLTYSRLVKKVREMDVEAATYNTEAELGLGSVYSMPGGLTENIYWFLGGEAFVRQVEGEKRMYNYLEDNKDRILEAKNPVTVYDVLNCDGGCLCGTAIEDNAVLGEDAFMQLQMIKAKAVRTAKEGPWNINASPKDRLVELNKLFAHLNISDYMCSYENKSSVVKWKKPDDKRLNTIFNEMNKTTEASRRVNCSFCGYKTCLDMAEAIYNGVNHKGNCRYFIKEVFDGITVDYPTVMIINGDTQAVNVVKYKGEDAVKGWIESGLGVVNYNMAIRAYIRRYVDKDDQVRVMKNVEFNALLKHLEKEESYSINYLRHPENGKDGYFRFNFTRLPERKDIVLAFQDIDATYSKEIADRRELVKALEIAKRDNELIDSFAHMYDSIYLINLVEDTYEEIKSLPHIKQFIDQFSSARECLNKLPLAMFKKEDVDSASRFYDMDSWTGRLRDRYSTYLDADGQFTGWIRTTLVAVNRDDRGNVTKVLCCVNNIHEAKEKEYENYSIVAGLSMEFSTLWLINVKERMMNLVRSSQMATLEPANYDIFEPVAYDHAMENYIRIFVDEADRDRITEAVRFEKVVEITPVNNMYTLNFLKLLPDGSSRYTQMVFTRTMSGSDQDTIVLAYRDIDETIRHEQERERKLEEALLEAEKANKAKSTFLANMSHEIRTPINAILGMDTMILRESNQPSVKEYAKNVKTASNTLLSLINDILDFSKIESGGMDIIEGQYRLDSLVNDLMNMVRSRAEEKGLELVLDVKEKIPNQLYGDEVRVKQIILNILNNAVKYTKTGKVTLSIGYEPVDDNNIRLQVSVKDTGIGIKKEDMELLFSPYQRLDLDKNKAIEGSGLGLSITLSLLEKMGSKLNVESEYGIGSNFYFDLCQATWGDELMSAKNLARSDRGQEEKKEAFHAPNANILVVDDLHMNITVLVSLLKRIKITPDSCLSGKDALILADKKKYDIIFLDAMMPEMSGEETLNRIRKQCALNKDTPIIVLTANAIVGAREKYIDAGFTDYLSKPIEGAKLESLIQNYLPKDKLESAKPAADELGSRIPGNPVLKGLESLAGISIAAGIEATGDVDTYLSVVRNFYDTAKNRIDMIEDYYNKQDIDNYTIQVHALKSSARLIGANALSQKALDMEMAGHEKNLDRINAETEGLLSQYKSLVEALSKLFVSGDSLDKKELTDKKFKRMMEDLYELLEAFDFETARELYKDMEQYKLPKAVEEDYKGLKTAFADVDRDKAMDIIDRIRNK